MKTSKHFEEAKAKINDVFYTTLRKYTVDANSVPFSYYFCINCCKAENAKNARKVIPYVVEINRDFASKALQGGSKIVAKVK